MGSAALFLDRLAREGRIAGWTSIAQLIPPAADQEAALAVLRRKDGRALASALRAALEREGFEAAAFERTAERLAAVDGVRSPLGADRLRAIGLGKLVDALLRTEGGRALALAVVHPRTELWTEALRGGALAAAEEAAREAGVHPAVASVYTVSAESARQIGGDFARISGLSAAVVIALVAIQFRSARWTLAVLAPLLLGTLWMAGAFALLGLRLNFMNLTVLPMIFGTGVDSGIHIVSRHLASGRDARKAMRSAEVGLMLAAATTMAGFGSLALSANRGLASIGIACLIGIGSCFLAAATALPAALSLLRGRE